jgi:hypothetical protein
MNSLALAFISAILMGLGATLLFDLWALFLRHAFRVAPSNMCLVGRWLRTMPEGIFKHLDIGSAPPKSAECAVGWIAHYLIGVTFAAAFLIFAGTGWLQRPTPLPAIGFGVITVLAPFLILQPALGFGLAASRTSNPPRARLRSLMNHTVFGVGLYLFGVLAGWLL